LHQNLTSFQVIRNFSSDQKSRPDVTRMYSLLGFTVTHIHTKWQSYINFWSVVSSYCSNTQMDTRRDGDENNTLLRGCKKFITSM